MAGLKQTRAKELASNNKENHPPKKTQRIISVGGLFAPKKAERRKSENDVRGILGPRPTGIAKQAANAHFSTRVGGRKKAEIHPLYRSFAEAATGYQQGALHVISRELDPICDSLLARVDGLTIKGAPLQGAIKLTIDEAAELNEAWAQLSKPLEEEVMTIQSHIKKGNLETTKVKFGVTMQAFEKVLEQKRTRLMKLRKRIVEIDLEMAAAYEDVLDTEGGEVKKARRELDADFKASAQEAGETKDQTIAEIKQARDDEKADAASERRNLDAALNS